MDAAQDINISGEPIIGYRSWQPLWPYFLCNLNMHDIWVPGTRAEATCRMGVASSGGSHDSPDAGCTCGFWAMKEPVGSALQGKIFGTVYLWGKVIECEYGYRAQYAYPKRLHYQTNALPDELVALISGAYGVPISPMDDWHNERNYAQSLIKGGVPFTPRPKPPTIDELAAVALKEGLPKDIRRAARQTAMQRLYMQTRLLERTVARMEQTLTEKKAKLHRQTLLRELVKAAKIT